MRVLNLIWITLMLATGLAHAGNEGGNGGGGIQRNGQYLTFGSAGMHVGVEPLSEVPGLKLLEQTIFGLKISATQKATLLDALLPDGKRNYFSIKDSDLDEKKREAFLKAYQSTISKSNLVPIEDIVVFAFTSKDTRETYLLPKFFELRPFEQATILFHEALWIILPPWYSSSYNFVIDAEMKFQKYLEKGAQGYDAQFYPVLDEIFRDHTLSLKVALQDDLASGALDSLLVRMDGDNHSTKTLLRLDTLFGKSSVAITNYNKYQCAVSQLDTSPSSTLTFNLARNMNLFPNSKGLRRLYEIRRRLKFDGAYTGFDGIRSWFPEGRSRNCESLYLAIDLSLLENSEAGKILVNSQDLQLRTDEN